VRLTKYLIQTLTQNDKFIDVGAHIGYYTLLAQKLITKPESILSFEPSKPIFSLLQKNVAPFKIQALNQAISNCAGEIEFYETDALNSEYNSLKVEFLKENNISFTTTKIKTSPLDDFASPFVDAAKVFIKIDTEGAEFEVLNGMSVFLKQPNCIIILEIINNNSNNYVDCLTILKQNGFCSYSINENGELRKCENVFKYLNVHQIESDNLVFIK
jgi:FkbM family methyltransferase